MDNNGFTGINNVGDSPARPQVFFERNIVQVKC